MLARISIETISNTRVWKLELEAATMPVLQCSTVEGDEEKTRLFRKKIHANKLKYKQMILII